MSDEHPEAVLYNDPQYAHMASGMASAEGNAAVAAVNNNVAAVSGMVMQYLSEFLLFASHEAKC
mgnify:FL=1